LFTLAISVLTGVVFGLGPAIRLTRSDAIASLKDARSASIRPGQWGQRALVVAEFALSMVLLAGTLLVVRSFVAVQRVDPGFDAGGVLTAGVWLPRPNDPARAKYLSHPVRLALVEDVLRRVRQEPGVEAAAIVQALPLDGRRGAIAITIDGRPADAAEDIPTVQTNFASEDYFRVMRIPVLEGRSFEAQDDARGAPVVVVNRAMARRYFEGPPIGRRIRFGGRASTAPWMTVVGVVGDVLADSLERAPAPMIYRPMTQNTNLSFAIAVRSGSDPGRLSRAVAEAVRAADPDVPTFAVRTMDEVLATATAARRFSMQLLSGFALIALVLSALGVYGVLSYLVSQRRREIGIRMALGARPSAVVRLVASHALGLAGLGVVIGGGAVLVAMRVAGAAAADLLFGVRVTDPGTLALVAALLMSAAAAAALVPARRAARVDPMIALRSE
jgi:predicted permease